MSITGHCLCGSVTYSTDEDPMMVAMCHCDDCQRQSGAAFSVNVVFPADSLAIDGETKVFQTTGTDSGVSRDRVFCPTCGSPLYTAIPEMGAWAVKAGTLDDRSGLEPEMEVWCERRHGWLSEGQERGEFARDLAL